MSSSLIRRLSAGLVVVTFAGIAADPVPVPATPETPPVAAAAPAALAPAKKPAHHRIHKKPVAKLDSAPPAPAPVAVPIKPAADAAVPIKPQQH